ncbi:PE-PGRS family protein PE_PGRS5-like [Venturia canescens]|uniref:PE-PGRS family protein PE_PGRS5-like n=1 Tax=Venturia canescens TaxID=32260 RepID=UPI001C9BEFFF|nr:PE-PGRS family protein PE_PGRS5-like [Venturia canescens]
MAGEAVLGRGVSGCGIWGRGRRGWRGAGWAVARRAAGEVGKSGKVAGSKRRRSTVRRGGDEGSEARKGAGGGRGGQAELGNGGGGGWGRLGGSGSGASIRATAVSRRVTSAVSAGSTSIAGGEGDCATVEGVRVPDSEEEDCGSGMVHPNGAREPGGDSGRRVMWTEKGGGWRGARGEQATQWHSSSHVWKNNVGASVLG